MNSCSLLQKFETTVGGDPFDDYLLLHFIW